MGRLFRIGVLLGLLIVASTASATAQRPDHLTLDGVEFFLLTNPLTPYLQAHPDVRIRSEVQMSNNWRDYVAHWEIDGDRLMLTELRTLRLDPADPDAILEINVIDELFPGRHRVIADWYSGTLVIPDGKMTRVVNMGYGSTYAAYRLLTIENGRVVRRLRLDRQAFVAYRRERFEAYRATAEFQSRLANLREQGHGDDDTLVSFLFDHDAERYLSVEWPAR